ncbi:hypothetical protein NL108_011542 [Boleophthalmus pectinirostris]|nr:hypothetical protein NL108_011542 [Boleophthalmus pectinirostris]
MPFPIRLKLVKADLESQMIEILSTTPEFVTVEPTNPSTERSTSTVTFKTVTDLPPQFVTLNATFARNTTDEFFYDLSTAFNGSDITSLFDIQSIKNKISTFMEKITSTVGTGHNPMYMQDAYLDTITNKLRSELLKGLSENITRNVCPINYTTEILKDLQGEYDMLKSMVGRSFGYALTALIFVFLILISILIIAVILCICLPKFVINGERDLDRFTLSHHPDFASVSSWDEEIIDEGSLEV